MESTDAHQPGETGELARYRPGAREVVVFIALVVIGLLVWFVDSPGLTEGLLGARSPFWDSVSLALDLYLNPIIYSVLALISGFVFPRGFYLWGIALPLHAPFTEALTAAMMEQQGLQLVGGTQQLISYAVISLVILVFTMVVYTVFSAAGMGLRYLVSTTLSR